MDDRGVNIDIVFRNGLKDFEVLPPAEIWDNIHPGLVKKQKSFILARTAALIAVVLSLSFLAYQWNKEISQGTESVGIAFNDITAYPESTPATDGPVAFSGMENILITTSYANEPVMSAADLTETVIVDKNNIPTIAIVRHRDGFARSTVALPNETQLVSLNTFDVSNTIETDSFTESFLPVADDDKVTERWSIAAMASPTYHSSFNSRQNQFAQQLRESEQAAVSYTGGVAFSYRINNRISIQSGLYYSSVGQEVGGVSSYGGFRQYDITKGDRNFEIMTTSGTVFTNNADVFLSADGPAQRISTSYTNDVFDPMKANLQYINDNLLQNFSFLELPIMLRYKFVDKAIDFNFIGGVSYNMLINNSVYTMVDGDKYFIGKTEGLNMMMFSSSLGMAMEYSFSEKLSLNLEPTFRYYLNPFNQLSVSGTHPYSFGIFSGLSYKF